MGRFRVQKNWISPLLVGGVPLVAVWAVVGILAQRGRSLVANSETRAVEQMISFAVLMLAIVASSGFLTLWQLGDEPINCLALSSGVLLLGSVEASSMFHAITGWVSGPGSVRIASTALPILAFSTGLSLVSWQSLRALKRVYLFHEVRLRPQVTVAFGGGLVFFLLRLTARRLIVGSLGVGLLFLGVCLVGAFGYGITWWRYGGTLDAYLGVAMALMAQAGLAEVLLRGQESGAILLATIFRFQSLVCVIIGVAVELHEQVASARLRLKEAIARSSELEQSLLSQTEKRREEDHELRSALVVLNSGVRLLMQHSNELFTGDETSEALGYLQLGASTLSGIVFSDAAGLQTFDAISLIAEELSAAAVRGVRSNFNPQEEEVLIVGNPLVLSRTVRLILDNAEIHAPGAMVWVEVSKADCKLTISIEDDGPGIAPDELDIVFERGIRGSGACAKGEGLGLAIARSLTNKSGWEIFAEERNGRGTRIVIRIPAPAEMSV